MSRVAKNPVPLPKGVTATVDGDAVTIKGAKGALKLPLRSGLSLVQEGDGIDIDIPNRVIQIRISDAELQQRREAMDAKGKLGWKPLDRVRAVSPALKAYAKKTKKKGK